MRDGRLLLAAPLSLTGRYARAGRLAAAGIQQAVDDARAAGGLRLGEVNYLPDAVLLDDGGTRAGVRRALDALVGADVLLGPYGSDLAAEAAAWAAEHGRLLWNHGGCADGVQRAPAVVSVPTPASRYLAAVLEALAPRLPGARVLVAAGAGPFAREAAAGAEEAAAGLGLVVAGVVAHGEVPTAPDADVLLAAGRFEDDVALLARLEKRPPAVAAVAAGVSDFAGELGRAAAEGVIGPSQWEEGVRAKVDLGLPAADVVRALRSRAVPALRVGAGMGVDYPAAQAYAAVALALHCIQSCGGMAEDRVAPAARDLRATTFFGPFGLGPDGRQARHDLVVVQWRSGTKQVVWPRAQAEAELAVGA